MRRREFEVRVGGRRLTALEVGPDDGDLVLLHTGTPGCRILFDRHMHEGEERGLRHVIYLRPGYEGSDRQPGRSFADSASDSAAVADAAGAEVFYSVGVSGGGAPALACGALLPERTLAVASIAALGPRQGEGLDWLAGAAEANHHEFALVPTGEGQLESHVENAIADMGRINTAEQLREAFEEYLCESDLRCLGGDFLAYQLEGCRRIASDGIWGWVDDDRAMWGEWGFDPGRIAVPVSIWQGTEDRFVPRQNGEWLAAHVPGAKLHLKQGEGHLSLNCNHYGDILDDLIASSR